MIARNVIATLDSLGLPYETVAIDPQFADTAAFCAHYGFPLENSCNTLVVASKKQPRVYAVCAVLATTKLDVNNCVRNALGAGKLSFAPAAEMLALTGMELGAVTPLGLPRELRLLVDARVMQRDWIILGGGDRTLKIKISPGVLALLGAQVIEGLALDKNEAQTDIANS